MNLRHDDDSLATSAAPRARRDCYWSKHGGPDGPFDDIVVGSGMGGMTTAALLARVGRRVLVLEQHFTPGGFTHSFKRPGGYVWDVGVHVVGEVSEQDMPGRILTRLTGGRLEWAPFGPVYEKFHFPDDFRIEFSSEPQELIANLCEAFPAERAAIERYMAMCSDVAVKMQRGSMFRTLPSWLGRPVDWLRQRMAAPVTRRTTADVLAELTDDPRLRSVLSAQWAYYGSRPARSAFLMQALITKHFQNGAFYPVGGSKRIAEGLLGAVAEHGGWTRIATPVSRILIERGRAVGVELEGGEQIRARRVFSAIGMPATIKRLLPAEVSKKKWARSVVALPSSPCHVCLHLGFRGDIRSAGATAANHWFWSTWDSDSDLWQVDQTTADGRLPDASFLFCSFLSLKDPEHDPGPAPERHTAEVLTFVPWSCFERWQGTRWHRRGDEYAAFKERLKEHLLEKLLGHLPGLRPMVDHVELSTPLSTDKFARPQQGAIYGIEATLERFANPWLRPRSPIPGLFFTGSDVGTMGVVGAMMGGVLAGISAEPRGAMRVLRGTF